MGSPHKVLAFLGLLVLSLQSQPIFSRVLSFSAKTGVEAEYQRALQKVGARDYRAALRDLEAAIRQTPHFYQAYNFDGCLLSDLKSIHEFTFIVPSSAE